MLLMTLALTSTSLTGSTRLVWVPFRIPFFPGRLETFGDPPMPRCDPFPDKSADEFKEGDQLGRFPLDSILTLRASLAARKYSSPTHTLVLLLSLTLTSPGESCRLSTL